MKDRQNYLKNSENNTSEEQNLSNGQTLREVVATIPNSFRFAQKVQDKLAAKSIDISRNKIYLAVHRNYGDAHVIDAIIDTIRDYKLEKQSISQRLAEVAEL